MLRRVSSTSGALVVVGLAAALAMSSRGLAAQAVDSTGMPSLEELAMEAGRASRRHPIRAVEAAILCEPAHPLVDSASLAGCASLDRARAAAITAAFARGLEVQVARGTAADTAVELPVCPEDLERVAEPRVLLVRITAPLAGVREGRWEGRLTVELRCRAPSPGGGERISMIGKEYLYQWSGRAWELYQHSWWRASE
jgi:hypothetical protein